MTVKGFAKSVVGGREGNQDAFLLWDERSLYAVADGVGGGLRGEVASRMSADGLKALPPGSLELKPLFEKIQQSVLKEALDTLGDALMGTTLTAALVDGQTLHVCHVGDSRCYLFDGVALRLLTVDHEIYDESLGGAVLASYMGIPTDVHPLTIHEEKVPLVPGNRLILCSDGLYKQMTESRILQLIQTLGADPQALLDALCTEASKVPHSDNVTVVYVTVD